MIHIIEHKKLIAVIALALAVIAGLVVMLCMNESDRKCVNSEIANCENAAVKDAIVAYSNADPDQEIDPETVDPNSYGGYIVELKDSVSDQLVEAALKKSEGVKKLERSGLYKADSLKAIENFIDPKYLASIEPDYYVTISDIENDTANPNDPYYTDEESTYYQWNLRMMNASGAWEEGIFGQPTGDSKDAVTIGVVDSGLFGTGGTQKQHEDLDYSKYDGGNNLATSDSGTPDTHGHGTFVSGLIMATMNNGLGVTGAVPEAHIKSEKVFGTEGSCYTSTITEAVYCAIEDDVDVINMSLGGSGSDASLRAACQAAVDRGILVVASAGNEGSSVNNYPAAYDCVIGVSSIDSDWGLSYYSSYGTDNVYCTAPGAKVPGLNNSTASLYKLWSGTSFSGPMVSALAAMAKSINPDIDQAGFKELIKNTSKDLGAEGYDQYFGWGCIDYKTAAQTLLADQNRYEYNITFNLTDEAGTAVDGAAIEVKAAEDISWEEYTDAEGNQHDAGSIAQGTVIDPKEDGTYSLHKGKYQYSVKHSDYYNEKGTFTTYMVKQKVNVIMRRTYDVKIDPVNTHQEKINGAEIQMTQRHGTAEELITQDESGNYECQLPEGSYDCTVKAKNYVTRRVILDVDGTGSVQEQIPMYTDSQTCNVTISVTDEEDGANLTDTSDIQLVDADGISFYALQEGDQVYQLPKGKLIKYTVTRAGYDTAKGKYTVGKDEKDTLEIPLTLTKARVDFEVSDARTDEAIKGAEVILKDEEGSTIDSVYGNPQEYNLPDGEYTYTVVKPGYGNAKGGLKVSFSEGKTIQVDMHPEKADVTIQVVDESGNALEGVSLTIKDSDDGIQIAKADGTYQLEAGTYSYLAYCSGYQVAKGSLTVGTEPLVREITLQKGESDGDYEGGSGTKEDPYLIATEGQLKKLAARTELEYNNDVSAETNCQSSVTGYYELVDDIELTYQEGETWTPIGNFESESNYCLFSGSFDGNGHRVSNLIVKNDNSQQNQYLGFFGMIGSATIRNLTVTGSVSGGYQNAGIVGGIWNVKGNQYGSTIECCSNYADITGTRNAGGIIGSVRGSANLKVTNSIKNCSNHGSVSVKSQDGTEWQDNAGGIAGLAYGTEFKNCYNSGDVTGRYVVGGIAAILYDNTYIYNCYNTGNTIEKGTDDSKSECGGIVAETSGNIDGAYVMRHTGSVSPVGVANKGASVENASNLSETHMKKQVFVDTLNGNDNMKIDGFAKTDTYPALWWEVSAAAESYALQPTITSQPSGASYICRQSADPLQATVDMSKDHGELTYQWYRNETPDTEMADKVKGASGTVPEDGVITCLPDTDEAGAEYYYAIVTNSVDQEGVTARNSAQTDYAEVQVNIGEAAKIPAIKDMRINGESAVSAGVCRNENVTLEVQAESQDGGELSYQWYQSSVSGEEGEMISGATESSWKVPTDAAGTWYYTVSVINTVDNGNPDNTSNLFSDEFTIAVSDQSVDEAAAENVNSLIEAIGDEITLDSGDSIRAARTAYDALTDYQKTIVGEEKYAKLTNAEATYQELVEKHEQEEYEKAKQEATPAEITNVAVLSSSYNTLKISWTADVVAKSYRIYRSTSEGGAYELIASDVTEPSYMDSGLVTGRTYYYQVSGIGRYEDQDLEGPQSPAVSGKTKLGTTKTIRTVAGKKQLKISWSKVTGAHHYQISVSTSSSKVSYVSKSCKNLKITKKKLTSKKRYYVKVRAVASNGSLGSWKTVRSVKVK